MSLRNPVSLYGHRGLALVTPPASEPVTAAELRLHMRIDAPDFPDAAAFVTDARTEIENRTGLAFLSQTWKLALDSWPSNRGPWWDGVRDGPISMLNGPAAARVIEIPRWPLASVSGVNVYDASGNATAVTVATTFDIDLYSVPGRMALKSGAAWPVAMRDTNAIEITFVAGYGSASLVPGPMKRAVKQLAAYLYSHRGDDCDPSDAYAASGAEGLMRQYKPASI